MVKPISKTMVNMIIKLYEDGMPIVHIAEELRLDKVTVHKYLNDTGTKEVDPEYSKKSGSRLSDTQKMQIFNLYKAGMTIDYITETVGCSAPTLYTYLNKEGLTRLVDEDKSAEAVRMYIHQKMSVKEISERLGISTATIYRRIKEYKTGKLNI